MSDVVMRLQVLLDDLSLPRDEHDAIDAAASEIEKLRSANEELTHLRKVAEKSFDYLFGETNPEFAGQCGGMAALRAELVGAMEEYREATDVDCRSIP